MNHDETANASGSVHEGEAAQAEQDRPNSAVILGIVAVTLAALSGVVAGVNELFKATLGGEISAKVLEPPSSALRGLRAMEEQKLSRYQWVSEEDGVVRIPLDRAIELTLWYHRAGSPADPDREPGEELIR